MQNFIVRVVAAAGLLHIVPVVLIPLITLSLLNSIMADTIHPNVYMISAWVGIYALVYMHAAHTRNKKRQIKWCEAHALDR